MCPQATSVVSKSGANFGQKWSLKKQSMIDRKVTNWDSTVLDLVALTFFLVAWLVYAPLLRWRGRDSRVVATAMLDHRRARKQIGWGH